MKWFKQNWVWLVVNSVAVLPLIMLMNSFSLEFTENGTPTLTVQNTLPEPRFENVRANVAEVGVAEIPDREPPSPWHFLVKETGEWAIRFLVFSLLCTPLYILFGWRKVLPLRKTLGLYALMYAMLHFIFFALDRGWPATFNEFNFILGLLAVLIMIPLAITSNQWSMRTMGKNWKYLHRLAYVAAVCAVLHVAILGEGSALWYGGLLAIGFILRIPTIRTSITRRRQKPHQGLASA
jgi:sulfoxide reductase heme-binding subunit YedZ